MRTSKNKFGANGSGQLLIVAALAIAVLISATTMYVYELEKEANVTEKESIDTFIIALKQCTRNTMISSLINASNSGEKTIMTANLDRLSEALRGLHKFGLIKLDYNLINNSFYNSGLWLQWNVSDYGVSSACANYTLKVNGISLDLTVTYKFNITTIVTINGYYLRLIGDEKLVNLTCTVFNEEGYSLARKLELSYERLGSWIVVNSSNNLSITDYGNGTYTISFIANTPSNTVQVAISAIDLRGIFVQAITTCQEI